MKYLVAVLILVCFLSCDKKEQLPDDRYVIEGIIENPGFDKFFVSNNAALQIVPNMVFNPNTKGYVGDSVWTKEKSFYIANYGEDNFYYYSEPSSKIRFKTKSSDFDESLLFEGDFADSNNYLSKTNNILKDTIKAIARDIFLLDEAAFLSRFDSIQTVVNSILEKNKSEKVLPLVSEFLNASYQVELQSYLLQYPQIHAYQTQNQNFKPTESFTKRMEKEPNVKDSMIIYVPSYRQLLMTKYEIPLQKEIQNRSKEIDNKTISPVYLFLDLVQKDSTLSQLKKDYLIGTFAVQFDYTYNNPILKEVNDSLQKVVVNEDVKKELEYTYHLITDLAPETDAPKLSGKLKDGKFEEVVYNKPTVLYFYTTADKNIDYNIEQINELATNYSDSVQFVNVNFDKEKDWKYFVDNVVIKPKDLHEDERYHSEVAKSFDVEIATLPRVIFVENGGKVNNSNLPELGSVEFMEQFDAFLKPKVEK